MGYELRRWVRDNLPANCTPGERLVALEIADDVNDKTRTGWPDMNDLVRWTRLKNAKSVGQALGGLAAKGWEFRVPLGKDSRGRPVFAYEGRRTTYRVPLPGEVGGSLEVHSGAEGAPEEVRQGTDLSAPVVRQARPEVRRTTPVVRRTTDPSPQVPSVISSSSSEVRQGTDLSSGSGTEEEEEKITNPPATNGRTPAAIRLCLEAGATDPAEAQALLDHLRAVHHNVGNFGAWLRTLHANGDLADKLTEHRAEQRRHQIRAELERAAAMPPCPHGTPGGTHPHPANGKPLCAECRRGLPAHTPDPIDVWLTTWHTAHGTYPDPATTRTATTELLALARHGASTPELTATATAAAHARQTPIAHLKETARA